MKEPLFIIPGETRVDPKFERKPSGHIIIGGNEVAHTIQCTHCGGHFISIHGSGIRRGFCMKCQKPTCGKGKCDVCVPFKVKLEYHEIKEVGDTQKDVKLIESLFPDISKINL